MLPPSSYPCIQYPAMLQSLLSAVDSSFLPLLLGFNLLTLVAAYFLRRPTPKQHHILFLTAHPDDECMFFRPTILALRDSYYIHVLSLSGRGTQREAELGRACGHLGAWKWAARGMEDGGHWEQEAVATVVREYVGEHGIRAVFTFDGYGVSGHANHRALHSAMRTLQQQPSLFPNGLKIYYLQSVALPRKYSALAQLPLALLKTYSWLTISPLHAYTCMSEHQSQFVWYRKLWILLSRYQYINTYQRVQIAPTAAAATAGKQKQGKQQ